MGRRSSCWAGGEAVPQATPLWSSRSTEQALARPVARVNNNPRSLGTRRGPIVEFSLEEDREEAEAEEAAEHKQLGQTPSSLPQQKLRQKQPAKGATAAGTSQVGAPGAQEQKQPPKDPKAREPRKAPKRRGGAPAPQAGPAGGATPWSGFQTQAEVEYVELQGGKKRRKVLALPSHRGPKIRKRDKGKVKPPSAKKLAAPSHPPRQEKILGAPTQVPKKRRPARGSRAEARFEQLVEQYKRRILGAAGRGALPVKRGKWFES
uniref:Uncharacterized protein n=1 Tax=Sphaerodactylus townsendi TaxID=933632 RepID=A0ACB8FL62_9SAUR